MPGRQLAAQEGVKPVVRFAMPYKDITVHDLILGDVTVKAEEHDDIVIRKSDGFPTYHFAVVVDDHYMGITHVLRRRTSDEYVQASGAVRGLGWTPPEHGHLPLVFNMDNTKMSKREKAKVTCGCGSSEGVVTKDYADAGGEGGAAWRRRMQDSWRRRSDARGDRR